MKIRNLISILILFVLLSLLILYGIFHLSDFKQLSIVSPINLIILIILSILILISNGIILKYLLQPFGIYLNFKEWFGLISITALGNLITPFRGGAIARAVYLKRKYNFQYSYFISTLSAIYIIIFLISSIIGLISTIFIYFLYGLFNLFVFLTLLFLTILFISIILFSPKIPEIKNQFINKVIKTINGWHTIKSNKKIIFITSLMAFFQLIITAIMLYLGFGIFGLHINFIKTLFVASLSSLSIIFSITPGALGIKEGIIIFTSKIVGMSTISAFSVSLIDRTIRLIPIVIFGLIFSYILLKKAKPTENNQENEKNI